jgi:hypothetical protein
MWKWILSLTLCRGKHRYMMHFLSEDKVWECSRCWRVFKIPESLTRPSGSFTEAQERAQKKSTIPGETSPHKTRIKGA